MTAVQEPIGPAECSRLPARQPTGMLAWLTSTDHKRIGISYMVTAFAFFLVGGSLAMVMRAQLAQPEQELVATTPTTSSSPCTAASCCSSSSGRSPSAWRTT